MILLSRLWPPWAIRCSAGHRGRLAGIVALCFSVRCGATMVPATATATGRASTGRSSGTVSFWEACRPSNLTCPIWIRTSNTQVAGPLLPETWGTTDDQVECPPFFQRRCFRTSRKGFAGSWSPSRRGNLWWSTAWTVPMSKPLSTSECHLVLICILIILMSCNSSPG